MSEGYELETKRLQPWNPYENMLNIEEMLALGEVCGVNLDKTKVGYKFSHDMTVEIIMNLLASDGGSF